MFRILVFFILYGYSVPHLAEDPATAGCENPLKEAVKLLRLKSLSLANKEIEELRSKIEEKEMEKSLLEQSIEKLQKDQIEHNARMKEKYEEEINALKNSNIEKEIGLQDELKRNRESNAQKIKDLNAANEAKESEMKKNQREEIETVRSECEEEIRIIKETHQDQENVYKNQIESKTLLVQYVMKVLQDTDELIDNWQNTVKEQAHEIN